MERGGVEEQETIAYIARSARQLEMAAVRQLALLRGRTSLGDEEVLALLLIAGKRDVTIAELSEMTALSRSGTGALVHRFDQAGLVDRRGDPADRRVRRVALSEAGHAELEAARSNVTEQLRSKTGELAVEELRQLAT